MNCAPGDLAIVIGGPVENLGIVCEVIEAADSCELPDGSTVALVGFGWLVRSMGREFHVPPGWGFDSIEVVIIDRHLRPIPGLSDPEQTETREPVGETA